MPIINKGTSFSNGEQLTADKLNNLVDQAEFNSAATDGATTFVNTAGQISISDSGISAGKLATNAVETAKILDANVTLPKIATQADQTVIANVSGGVASPTAVNIVGASGILINDDALGTSDTKGATQGNIKAYVDGGGGFTPASYTGGGSVTLPNGLIMKWGEFNPSSGSNSVSYDGSNFGTATINIQYSRFKATHSTYEDNNSVTSKSASGFTIHVINGSAYGTLMWQAIGY
jgi:hypothetical protein